MRRNLNAVLLTVPIAVAYLGVIYLVWISNRWFSFEVVTGTLLGAMVIGVIVMIFIMVRNSLSRGRSKP